MTPLSSSQGQRGRATVPRRRPAQIAGPSPFPSPSFPTIRYGRSNRMRVSPFTPQTAAVIWPQGCHAGPVTVGRFHALAPPLVCGVTSGKCGKYYSRFGGRMRRAPPVGSAGPDGGKAVVRLPRKGSHAANTRRVGRGSDVLEGRDWRPGTRGKRRTSAKERPVVWLALVLPHAFVAKDLESLFQLALCPRLVRHAAASPGFPAV